MASSLSSPVFQTSVAVGVTVVAAYYGIKVRDLDNGVEQAATNRDLVAKLKEERYNAEIRRKKEQFDEEMDLKKKSLALKLLYSD